MRSYQILSNCNMASHSTC